MRIAGAWDDCAGGSGMEAKAIDVAEAEEAARLVRGTVTTGAESTTTMWAVSSVSAALVSTPMSEPAAAPAPTMAMQANRNRLFAFGKASGPPSDKSQWVSS
jgi:hypothetical protein